MRLVLRVYIELTSWCRERQYQAVPLVGQMVFDNAPIHGKVECVEFENGVPVVTLVTLGDDYTEAELEAARFRRVESEEIV